MSVPDLRHVPIDQPRLVGGGDRALHALGRHVHGQLAGALLQVALGHRGAASRSRASPARAGAGARLSASACDARLLGRDLLGAAALQRLDLGRQRLHLRVDLRHLRARLPCVRLGGLRQLASHLDAALLEVAHERRPQQVEQAAGEDREVEEPRRQRPRRLACPPSPFGRGVAVCGRGPCLGGAGCAGGGRRGVRRRLAAAGACATTAAGAAPARRRRAEQATPRAHEVAATGASGADVRATSDSEWAASTGYDAFRSSTRSTMASPRASASCLELRPRLGGLGLQATRSPRPPARPLPGASAP